MSSFELPDKFFIVDWFKYLFGFLSMFFIAYSTGSATASTRAYFTSPELIELEAAYCLFSFSVSGVENIARGLSPK